MPRRPGRLRRPARRVRRPREGHVRPRAWSATTTWWCTGDSTSPTSARRRRRCRLDAGEHRPGRAGLAAHARAPRTSEPAIGLYHASPRDPVWEYVLSTWQADECLPLMRRRVGAVGPLPRGALVPRRQAAARWRARRRRPAPTPTSPRGDWLLNPGGVGQPRDGDPRAAWMLLDTRGLDCRVAAGGVPDRPGSARPSRRRDCPRPRAIVSIRPVSGAHPRSQPRSWSTLALAACGGDDKGAGHPRRAPPRSCSPSSRQIAEPARSGQRGSVRGRDRRVDPAIEQKLDSLPETA